MGFAEGTGLLWLAGMANGVRFFAPPYWKIEQAEKRAARKSVLRRMMPADGAQRRGGSRGLPLFRHRPPRVPLFQHGAHGSGLLVADRADGSGDIARRNPIPHGGNLRRVKAGHGVQLDAEPEGRARRGVVGRVA